MTAKYDHKEEARSEEPFDGPLYSVKRPAKRTKGTVKDTAQQYLDIARTRLDLEEIKETIRDRPYHSLVIAASAGFLFGGGFATTPGIVLLSPFRRKAVRAQCRILVAKSLAEVPRESLHLPPHNTQSSDVISL